MATKKKGHLAKAGEWWKHLRWTKREYWKRERQAGKAEAITQRATGEDAIRAIGSAP